LLTRTSTRPCSLTARFDQHRWPARIGEVDRHRRHAVDALQSADGAGPGDDTSALVDKRARDGQSDALAGAGDDGDLVGELEIHRPRLPGVQSRSMPAPDPEVRHPLFARLCTVMTRKEPAQVREHRRELLTGLSGRVLELGAGAGVNFALYPAEVSEVVAVEPEPYLHAKAAEAAASAPVRVTVVDGTADRLPAEDASVDVAIACFVLCSVPDQSAALAELHRVLRPGGELRFYEHVLSHKPRIARRQRLADRVFWTRAFGGCHTARDTPAAIAAAGFAVERQRRLSVGARFNPAAPHVLGAARRA
jgi:ubiquinone/menaquinone biosynthesis C-methylase UbiE